MGSARIPVRRAGRSARRLRRGFAHRLDELQLSPLAPEAARALIDELVPAGLVGEAVKDEVVAKAEGNPLYLGELMRALLETGGDRRRTWTITRKAAAELPPALEALLVARIDRLESGARRLAQVAAVVGRDFPVSVAASVAGSAEADIASLLRAQIVREIRRFPELECSFRHGLLQEAALATLTPTSQRELYGRVGHAMEAQLGDQCTNVWTSWRSTFYRSDETEKALGYLERAAEHAVTVEALEGDPPRTKDNALAGGPRARGGCYNLPRWPRTPVWEPSSAATGSSE